MSKFTIQDYKTLLGSNTLKCLSSTACYLTKDKTYIMIDSKEAGEDSEVCVINDKDEAEWYFVNPTFQVDPKE